METVSELQAEINRRDWLFKKLSRESIYIMLAVICVFFAVDSFFKSGRAHDISAIANAKVDKELHDTRAELTEAKNRTSLYIVYVQRLHADLISKGFDPPPLPEE